jgi:hypothetical protein
MPLYHVTVERVLRVTELATMVVKAKTKEEAEEIADNMDKPDTPWIEIDRQNPNGWEVTKSHRVDV